MNVVLPAVFLRTVYDKMFIAKEAKTAVTNCLTNMVMPETLEITIKEGCQNKLSNKKLQEEAHTSFLKSLVTGCDLSRKDHQFMVDGQLKSKQLVSQLCIGYESAPRIKKASAEILKILDSKIKESNDSSMPSIEELLKMSLTKADKVAAADDKKNEEAKQAETAGYDEIRVANVMKIFSAETKPKPTAKGKDFRSFLRQQKTQVVKSNTDKDCLVVADPKEDQ